MNPLMKFNILINPSHDWQISMYHALRLAQTITKSKHQLLAIFFYGDAVKISTDISSQGSWQKLVLSHHVKLMLCRTMTESFAIDPILTTGFQVVGMGQLTETMELADKTLEIS
jgi:sulfur relay (sulfurtransferase) complex TusBCD TusD component (DsrE family)